MRVKMKEPVQLEPLREIDEIQRLSNKELRFTKESMGTLLKFSEYCGLIRRNHAITCLGLLEWYIILSSMRIYVIVTSIRSKRCC